MQVQFPKYRDTIFLKVYKYNISLGIYRYNHCRAARLERQNAILCHVVSRLQKRL